MKYIFYLIVATTMLIHVSAAQAQRFFSVEIDSLTRSYLLVNPIDENKAGLPLIIVLHDDHVLPMSLAKLEWSKLKQPAVLVFPVGLGNRWGCARGSDSLLRDESLLLKLIFQVQNNFKTDPSRVFIVGVGNSFCLVDFFAKKHTALIRGAGRWKFISSMKQTTPAPLNKLDSLVVSNPPAKPYSPPAKKFHFEESEEQFKEYKGHNTLLFHVGRWHQAPSTKTEFDTLTLTDLSEYHFMFGAQVGYHFTERWSAYVESDFIIIPKEKNISSISWGGGQGVNVKGSGKGGIVIPYGAGVRYTFSKDDKFRPFVSASVGSTFLYVGGGNASFSPGSGQNKTIYKRKEGVFRYSMNTGFDLRIAEAASIQLTAGYTSSSRLEPPLASVTRFEGFSLMFGLLFLLGKQW